MVITTCRRRPSGGRYRQDVYHQTMELYCSTLTGASWCDVELETLEFFGASNWSQDELHRVQILASFHDFKATPRELRPIMQRLRHFKHDAIKIAAQCNSIADSLRVL